MKPAPSARKALAALVLTLTAPLVAGESTYSGAVVGARWLRLEGSARALALAGGSSALAGGLDALRGNPAGLAGLERRGVQLTHRQLDEGQSVESLEAALPGGGGALGLGLGFANLGEVERFSLGGGGVPVAAGVVRPYGLNLDLAWAGTAWGTDAGIQAGLLREDLDGALSHAVKASLGLRRALGAGLSMGAVLQNAGSSLGSAPLPLEGRAGLAWRGAGGALALSADVLLADYVGVGVAASLELSMGGLALRGGYQAQPLGPRGFSGGAGYASGALRIDYAVDATGELELGHVFSLGLAL